MPRMSTQNDLEHSHDHPEVEDPNEPWWNGSLLSLGISAIVILALFCMFYMTMHAP